MAPTRKQYAKPVLLGAGLSTAGGAFTDEWRQSLQNHSFRNRIYPLWTVYSQLASAAEYSMIGGRLGLVLPSNSWSRKSFYWRMSLTSSSLLGSFRYEDDAREVGWEVDGWCLV